MVQCKNFDIDFLEDFPENHDVINDKYDVIIDALFGFSFKGQPRPPFKAVLDILKRVEIPICSIDIPSGKTDINLK